ncbi:MAG: hypothetical protein IRZ03_10590 [Acidobacterium ailaaui]|nr:hypothetical protein [Pseudacidobacterium ailaaui]
MKRDLQTIIREAAERYGLKYNETEADNVVNVNFSEMSLGELEEFVQKAVKALSKRAFHAGFRDGREAQGKLDGKRDERKKSPQQRRDEIIEKAKRELVEIIDTGGRNLETPYFFANVTWAPNRLEFVVNREKRTVVALIKGRRSGRVYSRGVAKCHPDDCFNVHLGKIIALYKALGLKVTDEYLNAPQPTEVRVGDVVYFEYSAFFKEARVTDKLFPSITNEIKLDVAAEYISQGIARIIDDSREGVAK